MKKFSIVLTVALLLVLASSALAQSGLPGSGWWSAEIIMNVGTDPATIQVTAYDKDSPATYTASQPVNPGAYYNFIPNSFPGMPSGFQGSAVVSANQPVKAVVAVTNRQSNELGVAGGKALAQYQGIDGTMVDTTIYFPLAKGDYYNKTVTYYIQNAGTSATTATATFKMNNGATHTYTTPTIQPNQMVLFSVWDSPTYTAGADPNSRVGSVTVASNTAQPLAGVLMEHFTTEAVASVAQSTRGFTAADFDTTAFAAQVKNTYYLRFSSIQVQNVSGSPINVTVTYKPFDGCVGTYTDTMNNVQDGASAIFNQLPGQSNLPEFCGAAATIEATGEFVALVTESYRSGFVPAWGQRSVMSFAAPENSTTTKVSAPVFKDDSYSKRTGLLVQNVGAATATNVVATFSCGGDATFTAITKPQTIAAGAAMQFNHPSVSPALFEGGNPFVTDGVLCSVTITSDQPIVANANEAVVPGATLQQDNTNYEGFNLAP